MTDTTTTKKRTITLTDRPPVTIIESQWPEIAKGWDGDDRRIPSQSTRQWTIRVRRHEDGRTLAYGIYETAWQGEASIRGGTLLPVGADVVAAIRRVGEEIGANETCIRQCIADLPAEEI